MDFELQDAEFLPDAGTLVTRDPDGLDVGREIELHRQGMAARSQDLFPVGAPWEDPQPWGEPGRKGQELDNLFSVRAPLEDPLPWDIPSPPTLGKKKGQELGDLFPVPEPWAVPLPWDAPSKVGCCSGCAEGKSCKGDGFEDQKFELGPILDRNLAGPGAGSGQAPLPPPPFEPEPVFSDPVLDPGVPVGGITVEYPPPPDIPLNNDACCCCVDDIDIPTVWDTTAKVGHKFHVYLSSSAMLVKAELDFNCHYDWMEKKVSGRTYEAWEAAKGYHKEEPKAGYMADGWADMVKVLTELSRIRNKKLPSNNPASVLDRMDEWCDPKAGSIRDNAYDNPSIADLPGAKRVLLIKVIGKSGGCEPPCKCKINTITVLIRQEISIPDDQGEPASKSLEITKETTYCDGSKAKVEKITPKLGRGRR